MTEDGSLNPPSFDAEVSEQLLGREATMGRRDIAKAANLSVAAARRFWHAMGFPVLDDDDVAFTDADLDALQRVVSLVRDGALDEPTALALTRSMARTADRLAVWQTQLMAETLQPIENDLRPEERDTRAVVDLPAAEAATRKLLSLTDDIEPLLIYVWRRHLTGALTRMLSDASGDMDPGLPQRIVGFADLVNFTALVRRMSERRLAVMVQRFEKLASDVVIAHRGRVIKTVGDEILFVHHNPERAAAIAADLIETLAQDPLLPDMRVGMAYGPVVSRMGDVFGTTVNRASRLTSVTAPGAILVDENLAQLLDGSETFRVTPARQRHLRGLGKVTPSEVSRPATATG